MFVEKIVYKYGSVRDDVSIIIPEINRTQYMTAEYLKLYRDELLNIDNKGTTAFLYAGGPASHHSDIRNINNTGMEDRKSVV